MVKESIALVEQTIATDKDGTFANLTELQSRVKNIIFSFNTNQTKLDLIGQKIIQSFWCAPFWL